MRYVDVDGKQLYISSCWNGFQTVPRVASHRQFTSIKFQSFPSNGQLAFLDSAEDRNYFPRKNVPNARIDLRTCLPSIHATDRATASVSNIKSMLFGLGFYMKWGFNCFSCTPAIEISRKTPLHTYTHALRHS